MQQSKDERSLGELFAELSRETTTLMRQELALATTEMTHKASRVGKDIAFLAVGGAVVYAGLLAIIAAVIILLATFLPDWVAALLVGLVVLVVGYLLLQKGRAALAREDLTPRQTIGSLRESAEWAKDQTK